MIVARARF